MELAPHATLATWQHAKWVVLFADVLLSVSSGFQYANILMTSANDVFDLDATVRNTLVLLVNLAFMPGLLIGAAVQHKCGPWAPLMIATVANFFATALKSTCILFAPHSLTLLILAHFLMGLSMAFYLPLPALIASTWFPARQRTLCTAIASLADSVGNGIGFVTMPLIVAAAPTARDGFALVFIVQTVLAVLVVVLAAVLPRAPAVAPSATSSEPLPLLYLGPALKDLATNRAYLLYTVASAVTVVVGNAFPVFTAQVLLPFGVSEVDTGVMTALFCFVGSAGQLVAGFVTDRTRAYRSVLLGATAATLALTVFWASAIAGGLDATVVGYVVVPAVGFTFMATLPPMYEFLVELTFPTPLPIAVGCQMLFSRVIVNTVLNRSASAVLTDDPTRQRAEFTLLLFAVCCFLSLTVLTRVRGECRRRTAEAAVETGDRLLYSVEQWVHDKNSTLHSSCDARFLVEPDGHTDCASNSSMINMLSPAARSLGRVAMCHDASFDVDVAASPTG